MKSVYAINKLAKEISGPTNPKLPWTKVSHFQNSKQWKYPGHRALALEQIEFMDKNNIPYLLTPNNKTPLYKSYDLYVNSSKVSKNDFLTIIEMVVDKSFRNDLFRKSNAQFFYKTFNEIYS